MRLLHNFGRVDRGHTDGFFGRYAVGHQIFETVQHGNAGTDDNVIRFAFEALVEVKVRVCGDFRFGIFEAVGNQDQLAQRLALHQ